MSGRLGWRRQASRTDFDAGIDSIQAAIARGEVYQINYTVAMEAGYDGDPFDLFCALRRSQPRSNAAYFSNAEEAVLSGSPELFLDWQADVLKRRPMKGTTARGATPDLDRQNMGRLLGRPKERAENVMIVDLIRNDMSMIAQLGSCRAPAWSNANPGRRCGR